MKSSISREDTLSEGMQTSDADNKDYGRQYVDVSNMAGVECTLPDSFQSAAAAVHRTIIQQPRPTLLAVHGAADAVSAVEVR